MKNLWIGITLLLMFALCGSGCSSAHSAAPTQRGSSRAPQTGTNIPRREQANATKEKAGFSTRANPERTPAKSRKKPSGPPEEILTRGGFR